MLSFRLFSATNRQILSNGKQGRVSKLPLNTNVAVKACLRPHLLVSPLLHSCYARFNTTSSNKMQRELLNQKALKFDWSHVDDKEVDDEVHTAERWPLTAQTQQMMRCFHKAEYDEIIRIWKSLGPSYKIGPKEYTLTITAYATTGRLNEAVALAVDSRRHLLQYNSNEITYVLATSARAFADAGAINELDELFEYCEKNNLPAIPAMHTAYFFARRNQSGPTIISLFKRRIMEQHPYMLHNDIFLSSMLRNFILAKDSDSLQRFHDLIIHQNTGIGLAYYSSLFLAFSRGLVDYDFIKGVMEFMEKHGMPLGDSHLVALTQGHHLRNDSDEALRWFELLRSRSTNGVWFFQIGAYTSAIQIYLSRRNSRKAMELYKEASIAETRDAQLWTGATFMHQIPHQFEQLLLEEVRHGKVPIENIPIKRLPALMGFAIGSMAWDIYIQAATILKDVKKRAGLNVDSFIRIHNCLRRITRYLNVEEVAEWKSFWKRWSHVPDLKDNIDMILDRSLKMVAELKKRPPMDLTRNLARHAIKSKREHKNAAKESDANAEGSNAIDETVSNKQVNKPSKKSITKPSERWRDKQKIKAIEKKRRVKQSVEADGGL